MRLSRAASALMAVNYSTKDTRPRPAKTTRRGRGGKLIFEAGRTVETV